MDSANKLHQGNRVRRKVAPTVGLVAALAGLMFAANAQLARTPAYNPREPQNLVQLVRTGSERVTELTEQVQALNDEIDALTGVTLTEANLAGQFGVPTIVEDAAKVTAEAAAVGFLPVTGPGVTVVLDDAPASSANIPGVTPDDLVIHQQDLQAVIAALWAGGAEAMTLMGERVTMTSAFRCTGNVLLLHGRLFSPPFVVQAIGDPAALSTSVLASEGVQIFLGYVEWLGLGFSLNDAAELTFPAYTGTATLKFATLPPDNNPFRTSY